MATLFFKTMRIFKLHASEQLPDGGNKPTIITLVYDNDEKIIMFDPEKAEVLEENVPQPSQYNGG